MVTTDLIYKGIMTNFTSFSLYTLSLSRYNRPDLQRDYDMTPSTGELSAALSLLQQT